MSFKKNKNRKIIIIKYKTLYQSIDEFGQLNNIGNI